MARIPDLPVADPLTGAELVVVVQDDETKQASIGALVGAATAPAVEAAENAEAAAEGWASTAQGFATGVAGTLQSAPRNSGAGLAVNGDGPVFVGLPANRSRALTFAVVKADGTLGPLLASFDSLLAKMEVATLSVTGGFDTDRAGVRSIETKGVRLAADGPMLFGPAAGARIAWGTKDFFWDGVDQVLRAPGVLAATENTPPTAIVRRGASLGFKKTIRAAQFGIPPGAGVTLVQGASLRPKGKRTHQQCPSMAKSERYFYVAFSGASRAIGGDFSQAEGADSYIVICRKPVAGGAWTEVAQAVSTVPLGRISDVMMEVIDGRLAVFLPYSCKGNTTDYTQGIYVTFLENPDAPAGSKLIFSPPKFLDYGFASTGEQLGGEFLFFAYTPWNGYPNGGWYADRYQQIGQQFVTPGARLCRLTATGPGAPFVEGITVLPHEANAAKETYTEPQIVRLRRDLGAAYDFWATTRSTDGPRECWGTENADGTVTWTALAPCVKFNGNFAPVRRRCIRTAMGNIAYVGNLNAANNRREMGIMLSQDEAATFGSMLVAENASSSAPNYPTSYPDAVSWIDPASGRAKLAICYDEGRGTAAGYPANIWFHQFWEDELLAGSVSTAASMAARELVNQLEYTG